MATASMTLPSTPTPIAAGTIHALTTGLELNDAIRFGLAAAALTLEAGSVLAAPFSENALAERIAGPVEAEQRIA